ncbi:MAG TPA: nucleoside hydrolase [Acidimicrobiales bacterium]|nr:nucleoside hydrolase [Acidimicrobiales bacterium]
MARKIIIDCDPGHDDAMAVLLAAGSPEIELLGITTVAGNQTLPKTTLNARRICSVAGIDNVPICQGCAGPLVRPLIIAADVHGDSGLDGPKFPEPTVPLSDEHAVDFIARTVLASPGEVTLVPVGPLTNIAVAMRREPRIVDAVQEVVLMGGSTERGNYRPAAEFNILVDPEAAAAVFGAAWPVTMVGLNLTHQAGATPQTVERIRSLGTPLSQVVVELLDFFRSTYLAVEGMPDPPVHDPCAVARVGWPDLVRVEKTFVAIETRGEWTAGMTVTDLIGRFGQEPNVNVATVLDKEGFWDVMVKAIAQLGSRQKVPSS